MGRVLGSGCRPLQEDLHTAYSLLLPERRCWTRNGAAAGREAVRTAAGSRSPGRTEGVGGCRGEEWPHSESILLEQPGCQEGPPWSGCCLVALVRGARLPPPSPSSSRAPKRSWVPDGVGRDCGLLAAPGAHTTVGLAAPPPWGKGCRAASDWLSWEKGAGAGRVDACVCFQFSAPSLLPQVSCFSSSFPLLLPPVACSLRM